MDGKPCIVCFVELFFGTRLVLSGGASKAAAHNTNKNVEGANLIENDLLRSPQIRHKIFPSEYTDYKTSLPSHSVIELLRNLADCLFPLARDIVRRSRKKPDFYKRAGHYS